MLSSMNIDVKIKIRKYITNSIGEEYLTECGYKHDGSPKELAKATFDCMCSEFWQGYEKKRTPNRQQALIDYMMGLPSSISIAFTYYDQRQLLKQWLQQSDTESDKFRDDQVCEKFYHLIAREFYYMLDCNN